MKRTQLFFLNASIMTITSLVLNSVGVWFNLYIAQKLGPEGTGIFQLMMSVYSMSITVATSGISLATTRLVAEELAHPGNSAKPAMRRCLCYALFFSTAAAGILFFLAPQIGTGWLKSTATIRPMKIYALSLPCLSLACCLNGYFTAVRRATKCAITQIIEQFSKIAIIMAAFTYFAPPGLENACIAIALAGVAAEIISFLYEYTAYLIDVRQYNQKNKCSPNLSRKLLRIGLPVAFSSYLRSGLSTFKNLLVPIRLQAGGVSAGSSYAVFGTIQGITLPIIFWPYAFLSASFNLIIPELAQFHAQRRNANHLISKVFNLTLCFAFGTCGILFYFANQIGAAASPNPDVGVYIRLLSPIIPIMYLDTAVDSVLKGIDEQASVMRYNVMEALISVAGVWLLLPVLGIKGYIFVICATEIFNFSLSLSRLIKVTHVQLDLAERVVKPILCIAIAVIVSELIFRYIPLTATIGTAAMVVLAALIYLLLIYWSGWAKKL